MAKKKLLQDSEGQIWPITTADCVYLSDGSKTVKKYIDDALAGKANSSHGNHVPATQTANNAKFLRNDNTWQTVTPANIGAQPSGRSINFIADHVSNWNSASPMSGLTYAGGWHGNVGSDGYISLGNSGSYKLSLFIDGDFYAQENKKVYHEGNKPTAADIGAVSLNGGTINGKLVFPQSDTHYIVNPSTPMQIGFGNVASYGNLRLFADTDGSSEDAEYVHIASGSSEPSIDSGLVVRKTFAMCNNVYMGYGNIILNNTNGLYGRVVDGTPKYLIKMTGSNIVDVGDTGTLTCLLSNTNPTWWNGSISVPLAHANTRLFEGSAYKFGYGIYGTGDVGIVGSSAATVQGSSAWIKRNNYYAGNGDRFCAANSSATQLFLDGNSHKAQIRWSTNTPVADEQITWSATEKLVSSVYNVTIHDAAPTNPGWGDVWVQI